jgi:hypothetical protein
MARGLLQSHDSRSGDLALPYHFPLKPSSSYARLVVVTNSQREKDLESKRVEGDETIDSCEPSIVACLGKP